MGIGVNVEVDFPKDIIMENVRQGFINGLYVACNIVHAKAMQTSPIKTGVLRNSLSMEVDEEKLSGQVYVPENSPASKYAPLIELTGSIAHEIRPVNKKALFWKGASHPVKKVNHPGFKAKPFLRPALYDNIDNIQKAIDREVEKKLK